MSEATLTGKQVRKIIGLLEDTPCDQIQRMFASGLITDLRDANFDRVTPEVRTEIRRLLGLRPRRRAAKSAKAKKELFRRIGTVSVPPMSAEDFRRLLDPFVGNKTGLALTVASKTEWLMGDLKISDFVGSDIVYSKVGYTTSSGAQFAVACGGEEKVEISWAEVCWLVERFTNGQNELFLADGRVNIFFVRRYDGLLHLVKIYFDEHRNYEWCVDIALSYLRYCPEYSHVFFHAPRVAEAAGDK